MTERSTGKDELQAEIRRLAPFHHDIALPGGLRTYSPERAGRESERTRLDNFLKHAWPTVLARCGGSFDGLRVLDVGCNCGGFSVEAARHGAAYVLGIDVVDRYLEQANFILRALSLERVEFAKVDIDNLEGIDQGPFDVTLCLGILYHLENPISSMKAVAAVTKQLMVVDTNLVPDRWSRSPRWTMNIARTASLASKDASSSLWRSTDRCQFTPNEQAVVELLHFLGFDRVEALRLSGRDLEKRYRSRRRGVFLAERTNAGKSANGGAT